jgi:hypothetical protein
MRAEPEFVGAARGAGMYESFYLRAVSPREPVGVWIRHTVHKPPGGPPTGSIWCTVFDAERGAPFVHKTTFEGPRAPAGGWIDVGSCAHMGPDSADGECGPARWSLRFAAEAPELHHLRPELLYRAPLPRTKLTSPAPLARFDGVVELAGREPIELSGWPGMVGHNWGSEHAARWIWLHGCNFAGAPGAWLDVAIGRVRIGSRLTPWIANGALWDGERRHAIGGITAPRPRVLESPADAEIELFARHGLTLAARVEVPAGTAAGWRYADPGGAAHEVVNCSIASLVLELSRRGEGGRSVLRTTHGGAYEVGIEAPGPGEAAGGVPIAPFGDG